MDYIPTTVHLTVYDLGQVQMDKGNFQKFIEDMESGKIHLSISKIFTPDEITEAHKYMESNKGNGKIVVVNRF